MIRTGRGLTVYPGPFLLPTRESPMNPPFTPQYLERQNAMLKQIFSEDCMVLDQKEQTYKGSWRKRGGVGAMMMLARKWDRMENMAEGHAKPFDIFNLLRDEDTLGLTGKDGSLLAEIRDLRRYLALVEAYFLIQKQAYPNSAASVATRSTQTSANIVEAERATQGLHSTGPILSDPDSQMEHAAANNPSHRAPHFDDDKSKLHQSPG